MEKLSLNCHSNGETEVGSAFCRLADFSKELVSPMKNLDLKKPFDRSWRDYESRLWISVLSNSKQEALSVALDGGRRGAGGGESSVEDLTRTITDDIRRMPGNTNCCDCGAPDPGWLSTNLGILTCIECSGIHREMGVHVSRIHSLNLDSLGTSDLLLQQAQSNQFDHHVHVEYEWRLRHDDLYDSDDDFDDKNGPVKKERTSSSSSSFTSSFSFTSRPFSFSQSVAPPSSAAPGAPGGGLLSVGRRLAMAMDLHSRTSGTAPSPPPPPPSSPAPPLPPRVKGFRRADSDGSSSHFLHPAGKAPPNGSPTNHRSQSFESDGRGPAPQPLPRRSVIHLQHHLLDVHQPRGAASRRVQALYDCQADHHDELSFTEGQVLVVLGQDDCDCCSQTDVNLDQHWTRPDPTRPWTSTDLNRTTEP
ncbi:hypothetical protein F2P81_012495 [Scophthalmus maximus]|uniref:Arf-GAP domain-containing protein n=1 Tax=Scophthalmus maximus TaxID=52904 RepID=A0A6A4SNE4_SCOMX|nr:hypothetical protein F2P81_012495 [Scophthalmus maximus]